jgi:hypothetical protein
MKKEAVCSWFPGKASLIGIGGMLCLTTAILLLPGCALDEVRLVSYTSSAEVKPPESTPASLAGWSNVPWDTVLRGVSDILTGARKKAIEEKVGYQESRSFTLLRVKTAGPSREPGKEETPQRGDSLPRQLESP